MEITTLSQLREYSQGQIVELPPFAENQPFFAKLRRPSLLSLAKSGRIPNELLISAESNFSRQTKETKVDESRVGQTFDMFEAICEASFISPTYQELKDAGIQLTDDQMAFVFQYSQQGIQALNNFRKK